LSSLFITNTLTVGWAADFFELGPTLTGSSGEYWRQSVELFGNVAVCSLWFVGTKFFWTRVPAEKKERVEEFFRRLRTPVDFAREEGKDASNDNRQYRVVGWLCLAYGGFVAALAIIPNPLGGRLAFIGCGGVVLLIGGILVLSSRRNPGN
jgi:hypothetical protein